MVPVLPGIPGVEIKSGDHICALYTDSSERDGAMMPFLREGLSRGDRCMVGLDDRDAAGIVGSLGPDVDGEACIASGQLEVLGAADRDFLPDTLSFDRLIAFWEGIITDAIPGSYEFTRIASESAWWNSHLGGFTDLLCYEAALTAFVARQAVAFLCMYDLEARNGGLIIQLVRTHPRFLMSGMLFDNPYVAPITDVVKDPQA
ncbi:MEDS domain-containing protein [Pseudonocardia sp. H11422]|uniref:MEDS domain-containing protein n=1 Tax=Pseudonocardia sp. H11422 TaxID=2835866 RepID=UPI001BDCD05A|nr:MEDS domain-containing protein [Pseudonocardia sp. H11422]